MSKDLERFSATLAYIENHLFEDIILKDLAKKALLSEYTFHRFFTYLTGFLFQLICVIVVFLKLWIYYVRKFQLMKCLTYAVMPIVLLLIVPFLNFMVSHQARQNRFMQRLISFRRFVWISRLTVVKH